MIIMKGFRPFPIQVSLFGNYSSSPNLYTLLEHNYTNNAHYGKPIHHIKIFIFKTSMIDIA